MSKILEAVNDTLKDLAYRKLYGGVGNELPQEAQEKMDAVFGAGKHHAIIGLHSTDSHPDIDVEEHLNKHGYNIHDYKAGTAITTKKVGNPAAGIPYQNKEIVESIGKILHKTGASDAAKNSFANDPARTAGKSHGLKILISTHPYATIGKTSGTKWANSSCMNAESGQYRSSLVDDHDHATHEAFLIHPDDDAITKGEAWPSNPIARVSLKRFDNDSGDTIWRAETRGYGADGSDFHNAVNDWATKAYPAQKGESYEKHRALYDDGHNTHEEPSEEDLKNLHLEINNRGYRLSQQDQKTALDSAFSGGKLTSIQATSLSKSIDNLSPKHVSSIIKNSEHPTIAAFNIAPKHGDKFSSGDIEKFRSAAAQLGSTSYPIRILQNPKLSDEAIDKLPTRDLENVPTNRLKTHHIDKFVTSYINRESGSHNPIGRHAAALSSDHIDKLVDYGIHKGEMHGAELTSKNFTQKHADHIGGNWNYIKTTGRIDIARTANHISEDMIQTTRDALNILKNKNADNDAVKKIAADHIVDNLSSKDIVIGHTRSMALPEGSSKHFSDDDVKKLFGGGHLRWVDDKDLSNRAIKLHLDTVDHAIKSFGEKYDKVESPEDHPDFEEDRDNAHTAMYDHNYLITRHAEHFGSHEDLSNHENDMESIMNKHFRTMSTTSMMDKTKSPSVQNHLEDSADYRDANDAVNNHVNNHNHNDDF